MTEKRKHPYVNTIGGLSKAIQHFRNAFPPTVNASTLQKLSIAPNNESYVISAFRFLGFIDENDRRTSAAGAVFSQHTDDDFAQAFAARVKDAYSGLFELHGESGWTLDNDQLISFFRGTDRTSATVGKRQADTYRALVRFAGYGAPPGVASTSRSAKPVERKPPKPKSTARGAGTIETSKKDHGAATQTPTRVGLTVRVEINLPAEGDQDTYDRIFKSIRENLLND